MLSVLAWKPVTRSGTACDAKGHDFEIGLVGYTPRTWHRSHRFPDCVMVGSLIRSGLHALDGIGEAPDDGMPRLADDLARDLGVAFPRLGAPGGR